MLFASVIDGVSTISGYEQWGSFGVLVALLVYFLRRFLQTMDARLGEISTSVSQMGQSHVQAMTKVCDTFADTISKQGDRNDSLSDKLVEAAKAAAKASIK